MKQETNKDWIDAVREKTLSAGAAPSPGGWEAVGRRVRRSAALRRGGLTAAALLPAIAVLVWSPWRQPVTPVPPATSVTSASSIVIPDLIGDLPDARQAESASVLPSTSVTSASSIVIPDLTGDLPDARPAEPAPLLAQSSPSTDRTNTVDDGEEGEVTPALPDLSSPSFAGLDGESSTRRKPRLALRVHVSSDGAAFSSGHPVFFGLDLSRNQNPEPPETRPGEGNAEGGSFTSSPGSTGESESGAFSGTGDPPAPSGEIIQQAPQEPDPIPVPRAHSIPISLGVNGELALSPRWALSLGLDYTQRTGYRVYENAPQALTLHYLGVPLEVHYRFWPDSRFRIYLAGGLKAEKCFLATGGEPLPDPFLFSVNLQAGADVRILPGVRLCFAPVFSKCLNQSAYINTWEEKPQLSLRAGLSIDL